jgi:hypothetical protein
MSLDILSKYDDRTAEGILAAAALSTGYFATESDRPEILKRYEREASDVLEQVRAQLRIAKNDHSSAATSTIDRFFAKEISSRVLTEKSAVEALKRAGQAGRVPPSLYVVVQGKPFLDKFLPLGIRPPHVENAVKNPDEFQHFLTEFQEPENRDVLSLFLKQIESKNKAPHWLLVQAVRQGLTQNIQSAWRVFPNDIDLSEAHAPIDLLKALVDRFGEKFAYHGRDVKFVERIILTATEAKDFRFKVQQNNPGLFFSFSWSLKPDGEAEIGLGYCMNLRRYSEYLSRNGVPG